MAMSNNYANRGYLSRNRWKQTDQQPDFRGKLDIDGTSYDLAGWTREKDGRKYVSLKVQPARDDDRPRTPAQPAQGDNDIPF